MWRRASEPNPISVGELLFSSDKRYNVSFSRERREFNLLIRNVQPTDAGVYECQVSSRDKIIRHVLLKVNGKAFILSQTNGIFIMLHTLKSEWSVVYIKGHRLQNNVFYFSETLQSANLGSIRESSLGCM